MSKTRVLKIFISSPTDVSDVREEVVRQVRKLNDSPDIAAEYQLETMDWKESVPPKVGEEPQAIVHEYTGRSDQADIVICILGQRIGTRLHRGGRFYPSGTLYEFMTTYKARQRSRTNKPVILLYRILRDPMPEASLEDREQAAEVDAFFKQFHGRGSIYTGLYEEYRETADFGTALAKKLKAVIRKEFPRQNNNRIRSLLKRLGANPEVSRTDMIAKVRANWIDGVLQDLTGRVAQPFDLRIRLSDDLGGGTMSAYASGTHESTGDKLRALFDHADHQLLILGKPGAGKTFKLLELTQALLDRAEENPATPIPVVLNLSSWRGPGEPMEDWIISELVSRYQVPRKTARQWVQDDRLTLCLDGLDEITVVGDEPGSDQKDDALRLREDYRRECLQALNRYIGGTVIQVALCCREEEYLATGKKFLTRQGDAEAATIIVEGLTDAQVKKYLNAEGRGLSALRKAVAKDRTLREMAQTPFLLTTMAIAYGDDRDVSVKGILRGGRGGRDARMMDLFEKYVAANFEVAEPDVAGRYNLRQARHYLSVLARRMESGSKLLLVEQLQPDWLTLPCRRLYVALVSLLLILFIFLLVGLPSGWAIGYELARSEQGLARLWSFNFQCLLMVTLCCGGIIAAGFMLTKSWGFGIVLGLTLGAGRAINIGMGHNSHQWLAQGIASAALGSLVLVPVMWLRGHARDRIRLLDRSKMHAGHSLLGVAAAIFAGVCLGAIFGLARGLSFSIALVPIFVLSYGYQSADLQLKTFPNQGTWHSAMAALKTCLLGALIGMSCFGIIYGKFLGTEMGVINTILGLALSAACLGFGGLPLMQHLSLRFALAVCDRAPYRYVHFLNTATQLHLLRQCGGSYMFRHEYVRVYFRDLHRHEEGPGSPLSKRALRK